MGRKRYRPEDMIGKLRQVDVLVGRGQSVVEAIHRIAVTEVIDDRWCKDAGGLTSNQVRRMKDL